MSKPILIRHGGLTGTIYAVTSYSERNGLVISAKKQDVTTDAITAVREHINGCETWSCVCKTMFAPSPARAEATTK